MHYYFGLPVSRPERIFSSPPPPPRLCPQTAYQSFRDRTINAAAQGRGNTPTQFHHSAGGERDENKTPARKVYNKASFMYNSPNINTTTIISKTLPDPITPPLFRTSCRQLCRGATEPSTCTRHRGASPRNGVIAATLPCTHAP